MRWRMVISRKTLQSSLCEPRLSFTSREGECDLVCFYHFYHFATPSVLKVREVVKTIIHARDPPLGGVSKEDTTGHPH